MLCRVTGKRAGIVPAVKMIDGWIAGIDWEPGRFYREITDGINDGIFA